MNEQKRHDSENSHTEPRCEESQQGRRDTSELTYYYIAIVASIMVGCVIWIRQIFQEIRGNQAPHSTQLTLQGEKKKNANKCCSNATKETLNAPSLFDTCTFYQRYSIHEQQCSKSQMVTAHRSTFFPKILLSQGNVISLTVKKPSSSMSPYTYMISPTLNFSST